MVNFWSPSWLEREECHLLSQLCLCCRFLRVLLFPVATSFSSMLLLVCVRYRHISIVSNVLIFIYIYIYGILSNAFSCVRWCNFSLPFHVAGYENVTHSTSAASFLADSLHAFSISYWWCIFKPNSTMSIRTPLFCWFAFSSLTEVQLTRMVSFWGVQCRASIPTHVLERSAQSSYSTCLSPHVVTIILFSLVGVVGKVYSLMNFRYTERCCLL